MPQIILSLEVSNKLSVNSPPSHVYHPFQNHYTHEITIFELFRDYSYSFQGSSELISITVAVPCFSYRMQSQEIFPLRNSQECRAITVT